MMASHTLIHGARWSEVSHVTVDPQRPAVQAASPPLVRMSRGFQALDATERWIAQERKRAAVLVRLAGLEVAVRRSAGRAAGATGAAGTAGATGAAGTAGAAAGTAGRAARATCGAGLGIVGEAVLGRTRAAGRDGGTEAERSEETQQRLGAEHGFPDGEEGALYYFGAT